MSTKLSEERQTAREFMLIVSQLMVFCRPPKKFRRELVKIRPGDTAEINRTQPPSSKKKFAHQSLSI